MGIKNIMQARKSSADRQRRRKKQEILDKVLYECVTPQVPASHPAASQRSTVVADEAAMSVIKANHEWLLR